MVFLIEEYFPFLYFGLARLRGVLFGILFRKIGYGTSIQYNCYFIGMKHISLGRRVYINHHVEMRAKNSTITIGNNVMIGQYSLFITNNHNYEDPKKLLILQGSTEKKIIVEEDVWIGANVVILPGITIGKGSVIGAGAVVTKNVQPYSVMGGIPAKLIKKRDQKK